jgi:hypothetical protein
MIGISAVRSPALVDGTFRTNRVGPTMSVPRGRPEVTGSGQTDAIDRAPRGRELSVREGLTRIIVDWSGSWQAARPGNWLGRSPATKAALGC